MPPGRRGTTSREGLLIRNATVCNPDAKFKADVLVEDGIVKQIGSKVRGGSQNFVLDAFGRLLMPGFIDVHLQGAGGADILDGTIEAFQTISRTCVRYGVTGFLGTTVFHPGGMNHHVELMSKSCGYHLGGAQLLGIHLEGPFLSPSKRGMIQPQAICTPSSVVLDGILAKSGGMLRMMTIAPELEGALDIIKALRRHGVVASFGHSSASHQEAGRGIDAGISHVTHLFNAMNPLHHRSPGPILAILESKVTAQIISDGVHIDPGMVRLAASLLGENRCVLISDGTRAFGIRDGIYLYDGMEFESKNGVCRYADGTLIGTALGLNQLGKRFLSFTGWPHQALAKVASSNPAEVLSLTKRKGSIAVGKDADLVLLSHDLSVWKTLVGGRVVYESPSR